MIRQEDINSRFNEYKIIVPIDLTIFPEKVSSLLLKKIGKDARLSNNFGMFNLCQLNDVFLKDYPEIQKIRWDDIINRHLFSWIKAQSNDAFEEMNGLMINKHIESYFKRMPFIYVSLYSALNVKYSYGFAKELESKDYTLRDYSRFRFKERLLREVISKLRKYEILKNGNNNNSQK